MIEEDFHEIKATLMSVSPFLSSLLRRARIILSSQVPTACVTDDYIIVVNKDFLEGLEFADKVFVLAHETLHLAFNHLRRTLENPMIWNIAADAVVNHLLSSFIRWSDKLRQLSVTLEKVAVILHEAGIKVTTDDLEKMSVDEIYRLLLTLQIQVESEYMMDLSQGGRSFSGETLQEGDEEIYSKGEKEGVTKGDERAEKWKDALVKAATAQKIAGTLPARLSRAIDQLLQPKVDWRILLRQAFIDGFGKTIVSTYKRSSRKHEDFPGVKRYTYPTVRVLIDTSGSISEDELRQFVSEVYELAKSSPVSIYPWDADVYEEIKVNSPSKVVEKVKELKGGGGTVIRPALEKVLGDLKHGDIVVVFSDGDIHDLDYDATRSLCDAVASRASVAVFVSTLFEVKLPLWRFIKL